MIAQNLRRRLKEWLIGAGVWLTLAGVIVLAVGVFFAVVIGLLWFLTKDDFAKSTETKEISSYYRSILGNVLPQLQRNQAASDIKMIEERTLMVWHFGKNARYFTRPTDDVDKGGGFAGDIKPLFTYYSGTSSYYTAEFYRKLAGFTGDPPWLKPDIVVVIEPVEHDSKEYSLGFEGKRFLIKRFSYHVWLYDIKNNKVLGYNSFLPDPWPDSVTYYETRKRGASEGRVSGDRNYIGSNRALFAWLNSIFPAQRRFVWVISAHFLGKKAVRILSRRYSSSR